jgi:hypothetical protein
MVYGLDRGAAIARGHRRLSQALRSEPRQRAFLNAFDLLTKQYVETHAVDTYVFCLTQHDPYDSDGLLSMWRGYGGNGKGAAIVFDTSKFGGEVSDSPLAIAPVQYMSNLDSLAIMEKAVEDLAEYLEKNELPEDRLYLAAGAAFEAIKFHALSTKHHGFAEEREWRVVYARERDEQNKLVSMLSYVNGPRGVEPKLRLKVEHIPGVMNEGMSLSTVIHSIVLGPNASSPIAVNTVKRMVDKIGKPELADRVVASTIPYRPR